MIPRHFLGHGRDRKREKGGTEGTIFPAPAQYQLNPDQYLRQIENLKAALTIPVIASLNGSRPGKWIDIARRFQAAVASKRE